MKKILTLLLAVALLFAGYTLVYNEVNNYDKKTTKLVTLPLQTDHHRAYLTTSGYEAAMQQTVLPYIDSLKITGNLAHGGHNIAWEAYLPDSAIGNVVIVHGFTERKEKYKEAIYYFLKMGYRVFIYDQYSHGQSGRGVSDSSMVTARKYTIFTADLNAFVHSVVQPRGRGQKTIIYGHSMGGGVAARAMELYPHLADALVLSAPLMKIGTPGAPPEWLADPIARLMVLTGKGKTYALGQRAYDAARDSQYDTTAPGTYCYVRGAYWHSQYLSLTAHPLTGSSWQLASALLQMCHATVRKSQVARIKVPILIFQAGRDNYVHPDGQCTFINRAKNIQAFLVKDAGHELYLESDNIIAPYFDKIEAFMASVPQPGK
ncbi:MAG: alpha/beta hydrolase [Chitinophagia bacterium]|nr:alpha/beta hydrolase [Chitinophagia bacterium]